MSILILYDIKHEGIAYFNSETSKENFKNLKKFIEDPHTISVSINPEEAVPSEFIIFSIFDASVFEALNVRVNIL